jgi:hypothetical protein
VWRIGPEEGTDFARHRHRRIDAQALQSLNVKNAIVEIPFRALFAVNTLPLTKHLPSHDDSPLPARLAHHRTVK